MDPSPRPSRQAARAAAPDLDLLRSGSILIYCRSSIILSSLVYLGLLAKIYSDLYLHLIRQTARGLSGTGVSAGLCVLPILLFALYLAARMKPRLEKAALLILAANLAVFLLRRNASVDTNLYLALCGISLLLDLGLLAALVAFYRRYPNMLKILRSSHLPNEGRRIEQAGKSV